MRHLLLILLLLAAQSIFFHDPALAQQSPDLSKDEGIIAATKDLQNNILEIQENTKKLLQIKRDSGLAPADITKLKDKAREYLQELHGYNDALQKLNLTSLEKNRHGQLFILEMKRYPVEMEKFERELKNMEKK